jgi:hypothetical protein
MPRHRLSSIARADLKEQVLFQACDLIAAGRRPSEPNLSLRLPGHPGTMLMTLRDELRGEGRLIYDPPRRGDNPAAVRRAAERFRAECEYRIKTTCRFRAVKMAKGEFGGSKAKSYWTRGEA